MNVIEKNTSWMMKRLKLSRITEIPLIAKNENHTGNKKTAGNGGTQ